MFEKTEYDKIPYTCVESREHLELCEKAAQESIVLLKNNGVLPLNKREVKTIGVIGQEMRITEVLWMGTTMERRHVM